MAGETPDTRPKPFVFVLMPFESSFDDIYTFGIKGAAEDAGAYAERLDEQIFTEGMLDRIFNQISKADAIVADMTGRNPNVFYEVGYAHALGKIVLLLTQDSVDIPFDLKHRQHTVYGGKIQTLRDELLTKLKWAIHESRRRGQGPVTERLSIRLIDVELRQGGGQEDAPQIEGEAPSSFFQLPVIVRNDSVEGSLNISHAYLFAGSDAVMLPAQEEEKVDRYIAGPGAGGTYYIREPVCLHHFTANALDAADGLSHQYRLPVRFSSVPPGATEQALIGFLLPEDVRKCEEEFRLRVHTETRFYDYRFRLSIKLTAKD
ncbi:MAG TPA: hypothetical protein VM487_04440 [Phycisphaerae bacterium]|nr:hypothetical protein [Phycisphaerae bacterium]